MPLCICLSACLPVCLHIRPNSCPYNYIIAIWLCMYISQLLQYLMQKCLCVDNVAYLSVCIPLCISVWLSICLSTFPSVCRFPYVHPTICLPVCLSIYLYTCPSLCQPAVHLSVYLPVCPSDCPSPSCLCLIWCRSRCLQQLSSAESQLREKVSVPNAFWTLGGSAYW